MDLVEHAKQALGLARAELATIVQDIDKLEARREQLQALVDSLSRHLGLPTSLTRLCLWDAVRHVMRARQLEGAGSVTIDEIVETLKQAGYHLPGRNAKETIRSIINKKKGTFEKCGVSEYRLV